MTIATVLLAVLAFAIILWQETLLRKREQTIEVLREEIALLHEQRCRSIPSPIIRPTPVDHGDNCNCPHCR